MLSSTSRPSESVALQVSIAPSSPSSSGVRERTTDVASVAVSMGAASRPTTNHSIAETLPPPLHVQVRSRERPIVSDSSFPVMFRRPARKVYIMHGPFIAAWFRYYENALKECCMHIPPIIIMLPAHLLANVHKMSKKHRYIEPKAISLLMMHESNTEWCAGFIYCLQRCAQVPARNSIVSVQQKTVSF